MAKVKGPQSPQPHWLEQPLMKFGDPVKTGKLGRISEAERGFVEKHAPKPGQEQGLLVQVVHQHGLAPFQHLRTSRDVIDAARLVHLFGYSARVLLSQRGTPDVLAKLRETKDSAMVRRMFKAFRTTTGVKRSDVRAVDRY